MLEMHTSNLLVRCLMDFPVENPYLDAFNACRPSNGGRYSWEECYIDSWTHRKELVSEYAWAVPDETALTMLARCGPLVEIGAGGGYWAYLLNRGGVDIVAFDQETTPNHYFNRIWYPVQKGGPLQAAEYPDRTLFLCWPPYATDLAYESLRCHDEAGGTRVIYVGEGASGCTGCDRFHELLAEEYVMLTEIWIPNWEGIHDSLCVYEKRS